MFAVINRNRWDRICSKHKTFEAARNVQLRLQSFAASQSDPINIQSNQAALEIVQIPDGWPFPTYRGQPIPALPPMPATK